MFPIENRPRGRVSVFDIGRLVERRDDNGDEDGHGGGGGQESVMAAFSFGQRILSMAAKGGDVIIGELVSRHTYHNVLDTFA